MLKETTHLMDVLALLDPNSIPKFIITDLGKAKLDVEVLSLGYEYIDARPELHERSLITRGLHQNRHLIHRLVQEAAQASMSGEQYSNAQVSALELMHEAWPLEEDPKSKNETHSWALCEILFIHLVLLDKLAAGILYPHPSKG